MRTFVGFTAVSLIALLGLAIAADDGKPKKESSVEDSVRKELQKLDKEWSSAIVKNDAEAIGRFMSDDWVIIGPDGNVIDRGRFLGVIESGDLTHESMESDDWCVRVYGDTAVVTAQARSRGKIQRAGLCDTRAINEHVRSEGRALAVRPDPTDANHDEIDGPTHRSRCASQPVAAADGGRDRGFWGVHCLLSAAAAAELFR